MPHRSLVSMSKNDYFQNLVDESGYTIQGISDYTNIPISYLLLLKDGIKPNELINGNRICKLAELLDVTVDELIEIISG